MFIFFFCKDFVSESFDLLFIKSFQIHHIDAITKYQRFCTSVKKYWQEWLIGHKEQSGVLGLQMALPNSTMEPLMGPHKSWGKISIRENSDFSGFVVLIQPNRLAIL